MSTPKVAFVCVHNSCRSQMAEALGKKLASDVFESFSAGTETKPRINQDAVRIMKSLYGIDMERSEEHTSAFQTPGGHSPSRHCGHDGLQRRLSDAPLPPPRGLGARRSERQGRSGFYRNRADDRKENPGPSTTNTERKYLRRVLNESRKALFSFRVGSTRRSRRFEPTFDQTRLRQLYRIVRSRRPFLSASPAPPFFLYAKVCCTLYFMGAQPLKNGGADE